MDGRKCLSGGPAGWEGCLRAGRTARLDRWRTGPEGQGTASDRGDPGLYVTIGRASLFRMCDEPPRTSRRVPPTPRRAADGVGESSRRRPGLCLGCLPLLCRERAAASLAPGAGGGGDGLAGLALGASASPLLVAGGAPLGPVPGLRPAVSPLPGGLGAGGSAPGGPGGLAAGDQVRGDALSISCRARLAGRGGAGVQGPGPPDLAGGAPLAGGRGARPGGQAQAAPWLRQSGWLRLRTLAVPAGHRRHGICAGWR